jgi:hypothetical protein
MKKSILLVIAAAITLYSCRDNNRAQQQPAPSDAKSDTVMPGNPQLFGRWIEPIPGNEKEMQGFELLTDSSAKSINSSTLVYTKWWTDSDNLVLVSKSIGNHTTGIDTLSYHIISLTKDSLILKDGELILRYSKN